MEQRQGQGSKYMVPFAIVIAGAIIAGAIFFSDSTTTPTQAGANNPTTPTDGTAGAANVTLRANDHILGNPSAPVVVVEYSDLECPFCKVFHATMQKVMDEYGKDGKVAWVYRHFPLAQLHPKAPAEAVASECVAKLGGDKAFWTFINKIFEVTPANNGLDHSLLPGFAKEAGVDETAFSSCFEKAETADIVSADYNSAVAAGGQGTPYSVVIVNGKGAAVISGAQPYEYVKAMLDAALAQVAE